MPRKFTNLASVEGFIQRQQKQLIALNILRIYATVGGVVNQVLSQSADMAEKMAVHRAPVRRVFKGGRATKRTLSISELQAEFPAFMRSLSADARVSIRGGMASRSRVPVFRIGTRTITSPNRQNTWRASFLNRQVSTTPGTRFKLGHAYGDLIAVPQGKGVFELANQAMQGHLNAEGRRSLREARLAARGGKIIDIGRGALSIEPVFKTEYYHDIPRKEFSGLDIRLGGNLRASIAAQPPEVIGPKITYVVRAGGERAPYAKYMEFGTRYVAAKPFLRPALKHAELRLPQQMEAALARRFPKEGRG